ncbi:MAG: GNAT family N-acetyltransferase [Saprospiraceae bacterium]|nr:GNAT family N-acetyltransferase [Saprospiraceae bacterium]
MTSKINIRNAKKKDLAFVHNAVCMLENEVLDAVDFKRIFLENITNPSFEYYVAEEEGKLIGFISFHSQNLLHHCGLVGEIQEFYVDTKHRNQGVGSALVQKVKDYAEQHNLKSIEVTTNKSRVENTIIYKNLGFNLSHDKFTLYR